MEKLCISFTLSPIFRSLRRQNLLLSLLGEIDDLPLLVIELEVEAGIVVDSLLGRGGGLPGQGSPRDCGPAEVRCDFGKHFRSWIGFH